MVVEIIFKTESPLDLMDFLDINKNDDAYFQFSIWINNNKVFSTDKLEVSEINDDDEIFSYVINNVKNSNELTTNLNNNSYVNSMKNEQLESGSSIFIGNSNDDEKKLKIIPIPGAIIFEQGQNYYLLKLSLNKKKIL